MTSKNSLQFIRFFMGFVVCFISIGCKGTEIFFLVFFFLFLCNKMFLSDWAVEL